MAAHGRRSGSDATLVVALVSGKTYAEAAEAAGVGERTVGRRMTDPSFRAAVEQAQSRLLASAVRRVSAATLDAVDTLLALLDSQHPAQVRRAAARDILMLGTAMREERSVSERLDRLEVALAANTGVDPALLSSYLRSRSS